MTIISSKTVTLWRSLSAPSHSCLGCWITQFISVYNNIKRFNHPKQELWKVAPGLDAYGSAAATLSTNSKSFLLPRWCITPRQQDIMWLTEPSWKNSKWVVNGFCNNDVGFGFRQKSNPGQLFTACYSLSPPRPPTPDENEQRGEMRFFSCSPATAGSH